MPPQAAPTQLVFSIGRAVRQARVAAGLTQEQLAESAGLHRTYIGDIENARKTPSVEVFVLLANATQVAPQELLRRVMEAPGG